jgi:hypothetical protein|tara:strand:- start:604 stop:840 length:237 start_codon:yes stop_codon:yes gene_type:complete
MTNAEEREAYEQYLRDHITKYSVTEFLGRGKYKKTYFNLNEGFKAQQFADDIRQQGGRCMVYGVSLPPDRRLEISVTL